MNIRPKDPTRIRRITLPYSEVCMHMKVAGKEMWVLRVNEYMAQLYDDNCKPFSFPITLGEAGWKENQ